MPLFLIIFAGTPPTITLLGIDFVTTAFAAINTSSPIVISPKTFAPGPILTLLPNLGLALEPFVHNITLALKLQ